MSLSLINAQPTLHQRSSEQIFSNKVAGSMSKLSPRCSGPSQVGTSLVPGAHENVQTWAHQGTLAAPDRPIHNSTGNVRDIFPNVAVVHLHVYFLNLVLQVKSNYFHLSHWKSMKISDHPVFPQILWPFSPRKSPSFSRSQTFPAANPRPSRAVQGQWWRPLPGWNLQRPSARNGSRWRI